MTRTLQEYVEDYLNGQLSDEENRQFEKDLFHTEVAAVFREALIMRELLTNLPLDEPPSGLVKRIETSLGLDSSPPTGEEKQKGASSLGQIISGFRWALRWPGYALGGISGMKTMGYSLGPLKEPVSERIDSIRLPKKPLWKIALSALW